ncbi:unnamed protein product [Oikopleura dioica]|uniref:Sushi domain-containing protein n=1 Tax=Oikopleura dioica TaxID=34765 RepID=E4XSK5_OIKDI|nr:unnamed protein product [Oikopleura dioica]CBY40672.1 unnamed protein product [Oikopleura dioica]
MKLLPVFFIQALSQFSGECPPIRQYLRMGNSVRQYCSQLDRKCTFKCSNGLRNGDPENVSCKDGKWNVLPRTKVFCASPISKSPSKPKIPSKRPSKTPSTRPAFSSFNVVISEEEPDFAKESGGLAFGPLTDCGPVLEHFTFPKGSLARCSNNLCKVECSDGRIPQPKMIKCIQKTSKFWPRRNSEISCRNTAIFKQPKHPKNPPKRPIKLPTKLEKPSPCGPIEDSEIQLENGVAAECNPFGCQFRCESGSPNIKHAKCFMRKKRFIPKKAKIFCQN